MQNELFYPLSHNSWGNEEIQAIARVINSGNYTMGKEVEEFEEQFANKMGSKNAIMTNSGSSANLIMLAACKYYYGWEEGSEILVPAVSWSTSYFPITQMGFKAILIDVYGDDFSIQCDAIKEYINRHPDPKKIKAVLAVNLLGYPCMFQLLKEDLEETGIIILEDNCESLGSKFYGKYCGTIGIMGTFSFFYSHHLQTMEGGMVLTDNDDLADYLRSLRAHGWLRNSKTTVLGYYDPNSFDDKFKFVLPGYCVRPLEICAAIGKEQLKKLDDFTHKRIKNHELFLELFSEDDSRRYAHTADFGWSYQNNELDMKNLEISAFGFAVVLGNSNKRPILIEELKKEGIETRPIVAGNFARQPVANLLMKEGKLEIFGTLKIANKIHDAGLFFGNDDRDLEQQIIKTKEVFEKIIGD